MDIMLIAGEASGDLYGAYLAKEIKKIREDISLFGMGGKKMRNEGVEILFPISCDIVGATDAILRIPKAIFLLRNILNLIKKRKPSKIILIDFAEFNLYLLKAIKGIKTIWLFPPTSWAWRENRVKVVKKASLILSTLPIEADFYKKYGCNVLFIGHPLLDIVKTNGNFNIKKTKPIISLLPGSRIKEVERHLPIMIKVVKGLPDIQFFLILAEGIKKSLVERYIDGLNISIISHSYNIMAKSDLLITSSGTATLEGAILGIPMIVIYKMDLISNFLAKMLVKIKYASLPNIIAGREVIPEFLMEKANPDNIIKEAISILNDEKRGKEIKNSLLNVVNAIGPCGAIKRAALSIVNL